MWTPCKTKKERIERVRSLLETNDKAVMRGLVAIYNNQTEFEKVAEATQEDNGIGFNAFDAVFLSSLAKQVINKNWLSVGQITIARKRIMKYAGQLAIIAERKENEAKIQKC